MGLRNWVKGRFKKKPEGGSFEDKPSTPMIGQAKMGRPEWIPTPQDLASFEAAASRGLTKDQIAVYSGVGYSTMAAKYKEFPEIQEAIKRGRDKATIKVASELYETAVGNRGKTGKMTAMIFWLKNHGWSDRQTIQGDPKKPVWIGAIHGPPTEEQIGERLSILDSAREGGEDTPEPGEPTPK